MTVAVRSTARRRRSFQRRTAAAVDKATWGAARVLEAMREAPDESSRAQVLATALAALARVARTGAARNLLGIAAGAEEQAASRAPA